MWSCPKHAIIRLCILCSVLLLLGCSPNPFERRSVIDRWSSAVLREDYSTAERFMEPMPATVQWLAETQQLIAAHGGFEFYQRGDIAMPPGENPVALTRWTWQSGLVRCVRVAETAQGTIILIDTTYQDCASVAEPETPAQPPAPGSLPTATPFR
jgi:hypothetical protein